MADATLDREFKKKDINPAEGRAVNKSVVTAGQIMDTDHPVIDINLMISDAYYMMKEKHVDCLPVAENGHVVRMITLNNIEIIRSPFFDAPGQEERRARLMCLPLSNVNQGQELVKAASADSLKDVMTLMAERGIQSIPVLKETGELAGMVTSHGVLEYFLNRTGEGAS